MHMAMYHTFKLLAYSTTRSLENHGSAGGLQSILTFDREQSFVRSAFRKPYARVKAVTKKQQKARDHFGFFSFPIFCF